ncbi:MAG TPA: ATP-grasp domain-containing protein [Gemmatimonadales bacterium]|nr:ATP-grasp domain-containing protein [Gemmatimonadales bacterium]
MTGTAAGVLVTDGEQRAALAVVRSLGRAGHRVYVCSTRGRSLAGASRYAAGEARTPDPLREPAAFVEALAALARRWDVAVVLPIAEPALLAVLGARERLAGCRVPFPDLERFRAISDKAHLLAVAPEVGIAIPAQQLVPSPAALAELDLDALCYPLVLKPARSVGEAGGERRKLAVRHAADAAEVRRVARELPAAAFPLLLQQRVVGPGIGIFLLRWRGETVAAFAHRRLREKPPSGGISVYRESIAAPPELLARSQALLERFDWEGVAMVEYKVDAASGRPYLMEVNGRFWGSLQLAVDAGVDFPALLVALALGERPAPVRIWRAVRSRWWWGDVDHLLARLRRSERELALPPGSPGRLRTVVEFLRLWRPGDRNEILRWTDPRPFLRETLEWIQGR